MSSDLLCFESTFYSSSDFFSDSLSFDDILDDPKPHFLDQNVFDFHTQLSSSPPCQQMGNLTLSQNTPFQNFSPLSNGVVNFSSLDMNMMNSQVLGDGCFGDSSFDHNNCFNVNQNVGQVLQRSFSSKSFTEDYGAFNLPNLLTQIEESPEITFFSAQLRRVYSTGDLQEKRGAERSCMERCFVEDANLKVGRYSADERRERIHKYKAKRSQRNFNKTIKYACRKALADNRPRIRGRFVRNDEVGETPNTDVSTKDEEDAYLSVEGFNVEDYEGTIRGGQFMNNAEPTQFQYYGH